MSDINFDCPHCGQNLDAPDDMAGEAIECPACGKEFTMPGGIIEIPKPAAAAMPSNIPPSSPAIGSSVSDVDKGKTVRIELPPEFLDEPEKHIFKIKRIQR